MPQLSSPLLRMTAIASAGALALFGLSACSTPASTPEPESTNVFGLSPVDSVTDLIPQEIKDKGSIDVAVYNDGAPQDYLDENGDLVGIQLDFAQAVSELAGLNFTIIGVGGFDTLIPGLQGGRYDAAFPDFGITAERQKIIDLVYQFDLGTGFAVKEGSSLTLDTADDLCGTKLATLAGSYFIDQVTAISADCESSGKAAIEIQTYPTQADGILSVTTGRADAYATSSDQLGFAAKADGAQLSVQKFEYQPIPQGIGVPKDSALGPVIEAALKELVANGTYGDILEKWGIPNAAITADEISINPVD